MDIKILFETPVKASQEGRGFLMDRILVTGGAGYVGSACCTQLCPEDSPSRWCMICRPDTLRPFRRVRPLHRFDIADRDALESLLAHTKFDALFHFAAKALYSPVGDQPWAFFRCQRRFLE